jgi:iron complex outermembrane receptor protein
MNYIDQLVLTGEINDVGSPVMSNVPRSFRQGIEISASLQPWRELSWSGNLTLSRNKVKHYLDHIDNWDYWNDPEKQSLQVVRVLGETDIAFSPSVIASSQFQYRPVKYLKLSLDSKFVGKQYIDNTSNTQRMLHAYLVNDLRINATFNLKLIRLETIISVNNLFNGEYETNAWLYQYIEGNELKTMDGFFPQAGRNYMFSCIFNF